MSGKVGRPQLRVVERDRSHRPANDAEPQPAAGPPELPYFLKALDDEHIERLLDKLTVKQLQAHAKALNVTGYSRMRQATLVAKLLEVEQGPRTSAWRYLLRTLEPLRVVTPADGAALALGVDALVEYIELARTLEREGRYWTTLGRYGKQVKRHPALEAIGKTWGRVLAVLDRFGANPAYRARVKAAAAGESEGSPWDDLEGLGLR